MDTLRGFVRAVWTTDKAVKHEDAVAGVWSKPDDISGSYELRRLTTSKNREGVLTDFFELYWAHRMEGTALSHVLAWARRLVLRAPWDVPPALRGAWAVIVVLLALAAFFAVQTALPEANRLVELPPWLTAAIGAVSAVAVVPVVRRVLGDAARYLDPAPDNIQRRQEIRAAGVEILDKLHASGEYGRVVVVGHSLGSVIGYDILTHAWPSYASRVDRASPSPVMDHLEAWLSRGQSSPGCRFDVNEYRGKQRALADELRARTISGKVPWLVTNFVTVGSPLAHAALLLADGADELDRKQEEREFPTCPPVLEDGRFSYPTDSGRRRPHHAAVFAPTRWTNIYAPARWLVHGDLIGGPLADVFGEGVMDVEVRPRLRGGFLCHTLYWTPERGETPGAHVARLRDAVNLLDADQPGPGGAQP